MVDVITTIEIDRPIDEVARYSGDPSKAPEWYENIHAVEWETPPPRRANTKDLRRLKGVLESRAG